MKVFPVYFLPAFIPFIAFGQTAQQEVNRVFDLFRIILSSSQVLVAIAVTLAFFYFFYNIAIYIRNRGRDGSKGAEEAKEKLLWSVVAIFVLTSIWGIIFFLFRVFIGDSAPGSAAVGDGLPIWSLRLPIDPFTPQNVGPGDRGSPGIDDRGSPGVNDRTGPGIGDRTGGVIDINVGTDTDGIRQ
ncbi:MAG: hypothetical protein OYG31_00405, partial [Candidatus Kaiserbacteria bacterium]|nr:hypothetical protein [Candidatus Kaiserbacteria bacterium]